MVRIRISLHLMDGQLHVSYPYLFVPKGMATSWSVSVYLFFPNGSHEDWAVDELIVD